MYIMIVLLFDVDNQYKIWFRTEMYQTLRVYLVMFHV